MVDSESSPQQEEYTNRISNEAKKDMLRMFAGGETIPSVIDRLETRFNIKTTYNNVWKNYFKKPKFQKRIAELREVMNEELMKIPIASKSVRLLKLQQAVEIAIRDRDMRPVAALIREVGNLMEGFEGGKGAGITLIQILKDFAKWERGKVEDGEGFGSREEVDPIQPGKPDRVDSPGTRNYRIL